MKLTDKNFELSKQGREELLHKVCVEFGYCSLGDVYDQLIDSPPPTISEFVNAIILGEGLVPEATPNRRILKMRDWVIDAVKKHNGRVW